MRFAFKDFVFDDDQYRLRKGETVLNVDTKSLILLSYFLKHPGKLIGKEELITQVWDGRAMSDNIVSVNIARLRKTLGDREGERDFIVNVTGRGYRFLPQVTSIVLDVIESVPSSKPLQSSVERTPLPLVGRQSVMQRLDSALSDARAGTGSICMLVGEPGIGKTRLAEVFEQCNASSEALWAWARCHSTESDPPLWLWTQILRDHINTELAEEIRHVLNERISELTRYTNEGDWANELGAPRSSTGHRIFDGIIQLLKKLSEKRPAVIVLDDLQWADAASLRLLRYLTTEISRWPLLVIGTVRTTEFDPKDSRNKHLSYILGHRNCERIALDRLSETDVAAYVAAVFGNADATLTRTVFEKSEGNPFFMVELLRPWIGSKRPQTDELGFSAYALDIVRQRVRAFSPETRTILSVAAIIGRTFDLKTLSYLTEREEVALLIMLDEALANDTIVASITAESRDRAPVQYAFSHELIREVLYQELNSAERRSWHLRAGEWLEKRRGSGLDVATAELAHHFLSALPYGQVAKAVSYANKAANEAASFFAYADVYSWLQRAIQALQSDEHPDLQTLCSLLLILSLTSLGLSDGRYLDYLNQAVKIATENGFSRLLAMAGQQLSMFPGIMALPGAVRVLETAESMLPEEDKPERAMVLAHLAWTPPHCMNASRVNELLGRAEALARESGSESAVTTVLRGKLFFSAGPADYPKAVAIAEELEQLIRSEPRSWAIASLDIQLFRIVTSIQRGDQSGIQQALDALAATAQIIKSVELAWVLERIAVVLRMNAGEIEGISQALSQLRERAEGFSLDTLQMLCDLDLGVLLSQTADLQPFSAHARNRLKYNQTDAQSIWATKIRSMVEFGLIKEAETTLKRISIERILEFPIDLNYLSMLGSLAIGSIATGATEYVEAVYELLKPYPQFYAAGFTFHCDGSVSYFLGMLARTLGRRRDAIEHLEHALEQNARFNLKAQVVRTRCELARTLAEDATAPSSLRAHGLLEQAMEEARSLSLQKLYDEAERLIKTV